MSQEVLYTSQFVCSFGKQSKGHVMPLVPRKAGIQTTLRQLHLRMAKGLFHWKYETSLRERSK